MRVRVVALRVPLLNRTPVRISSNPDTTYDVVIITRRPTVSKNRPRSSEPRKLPMASGTRYHGALAVSTPRISLRTSAKVKKTEL
jgi:hypothetical protein